MKIKMKTKIKPIVHNNSEDNEIIINTENDQIDSKGVNKYFILLIFLVFFFLKI
jgi:hypothetical protein